jgi:hypothetical protein
MAAESEIQQFLSRLTGTGVSVYNAAMRGGEIQAFFRQGFGELGEALKAFPDSIQHHEPGAIFTPLYSDIAADKREAAYPSPGDLAEGKGLTQPSHDQGQQQKPNHGISM